MEGGAGRQPVPRAPGVRRLVVSIHDVAPSTASEVAWLRRHLDDLGIRRRVLKVIPFERGERLVGDDPGLVEALRDEQRGGSEILLHGWTHHASAEPLTDRAAPARPQSTLDRARVVLFARDAAEFASLPPAEARRRVEAGRAHLEGLGLSVAGFCPPGWLAGPGLADVLRETGFAFLVTYGWLWPLDGGRRRLLPGFGSMGTGDVQEALVAAEGGFVLLADPWLPVVRVFLHPQGAPRSAATARALRGLERLARAREVVTLRDLLEPLGRGSVEGRAA